MKIKINWIAVQPTPYNKYFFDELKRSELYNFQLYYSMEKVKNLPFKQKLIEREDEIVNESLLIDWKLILRAFKRSEIFVCVGWETKTKLLVLFIRSLLKLPYGFWTDSVKTKELNRNTFSFKIKQFLLKNATAVFTTGDFGVKQMKESGLFTDEEKLISLPFFVPLSETQKITSKGYTDNHKVDIDIKFLTLSRLIARKGLEDTIEVVRLLKEKNIRAELYIGGLGELKDKLKALIVEKSLEDRVFLLGWLDAENLVKYRNKCNIALHLVNDLDPFPLTVLESLAFGLPVIGTDVAGSVVDRVKNGVNGYIVPPSSPETVADLILEERLYTPEKLFRLSKNARILSENWPVHKGRKIVEKGLMKVL